MSVATSVATPADRTIGVATPARRWLNGKAARAFLECDVRVWDRMVESGLVRYRTLPGMTRKEFDRLDLERLLNEAVREPVTAKADRPS
jgi:hypothetical protein